MSILLSLASALVWGVSDFAAGLLSKHRSALVVLGWSSVLGCAYVTVAALLVDDWSGASTWLPWGVASACAGGIGMASYYAALASGTMGVVAPVASLGVVVPVAVGFVAGERPSAVAVAGIVLAIVGVVLASGPELSGGAAPRPLLLALLAGVALGFFIICLDEGSHASALMTMWAGRTSLAILFVAAAVATRRTGSFHGREIPLILLVSAGDLTANITLAYATTLGLISIASVLSSLFPVVTVVCAYVFLRERLRSVQVAGVVVTMLGVVAITLG